MIKIDENLLLQDLIYTARRLHSNPFNRNFINHDYPKFIALNNCLAQNFGKILRVEELFCDPYKVQEIINKHSINSTYRFLSYITSNKELIENTFSNYKKILDDMNFYSFPYYSAVRGYNESDFKDIILSYYSTYGNVIYNVAKKYFEENRIQIGHPYFEGSEYAGFFADLQWLCSGYIFSVYNYYDTLSAGALVHELGHAVDAELFLFPQQKNIDLFSDFLCEVPSTAFELGFLDYVKDNKIDEDGSRVLNNAVVNNIFAYSKDIIDFYKLTNYELFDDGVAEDKSGNEYDIREDLLYGLGYYISMHLNLIRKTSPNDFLRILNNISTSRKESTLEHTIELMGISEDDFKSGFYIKPKLENDYLELKKRYRH